MKKFLIFAVLTFCFATQCSEKSKSQDNNDNSPACTSSCCLRSNNKTSGSDSKKSSPTNAAQQAQVPVIAVMAAATKRDSLGEGDELPLKRCTEYPLCQLCHMGYPVNQLTFAHD